MLLARVSMAALAAADGGKCYANEVARSRTTTEEGEKTCKIPIPLNWTPEACARGNLVLCMSSSNKVVNVRN